MHQMLLVSFITVPLLSQNMNVCWNFITACCGFVFILISTLSWLLPNSGRYTQQYNLPLNKGVCSFPEVSFSFINMTHSLLIGLDSSFYPSLLNKQAHFAFPSTFVFWRTCFLKDTEILKVQLDVNLKRQSPEKGKSCFCRGCVTSLLIFE